MSETKQIFRGITVAQPCVQQTEMPVTLIDDPRLAALILEQRLEDKGAFAFFERSPHCRRSRIWGKLLARAQLYSNGGSNSNSNSSKVHHIS